MLSKRFSDSRRDKHERLVKYMAGIYGNCPACGNSSCRSRGLGVRISPTIRPDSRSAILEDAILRRDWLVAATIREFRATEDAIAYLFLRCQKSK
jgi:hypothetical protein